MQIKRKGIYLADLGEREDSSVECGIRPVLVLQNNMGNKYSPTVIVAPITTKLKKHNLPTHINFTNPALERNSMVLLEQIQTVDKSRLTDYKGDATEGEMNKIERAVHISLGMHFEGEENERNRNENTAG